MQYESIFYEKTFIKNRLVFVIKGAFATHTDILAKLYWCDDALAINYSDELELELTDAAKIVQLAVEITAEQGCVGQDWFGQEKPFYDNKGWR